MCVCVCVWVGGGGGGGSDIFSDFKIFGQFSRHRVGGPHSAGELT